jgi:hypothetical protein
VHPHLALALCKPGENRSDLEARITEGRLGNDKKGGALYFEQDEEGEGETMALRRISVLLGAVVLAMMLSMGTALADQVCLKGDTISGFSDNGQDRFLNRHPNADPGACGGGGGANIPRIIVHATTSWIR